MIDWNEHFYYDETSPSCLRWKTDRWAGNTMQVLVCSKDDVAGYIRKDDKRSYWVTKLYENTAYTQNVIVEMHGDIIPDGYVVDHIDGNSLNNVYSNLRITTQAVNCRNRKCKKVGMLGVYKDAPNKAGFFRYKAHYSKDGKLKTKTFSCAKYGEA